MHDWDFYNTNEAATLVGITSDPTEGRRKRRSIRLRGYDYSQAGAYYVTICTRNRECLFGAIVDGQMQLTEAGQIVQTVWEGSAKSYEGVELDAFVVMPNHVHGLVLIGSPGGAIHELPLPSESRGPPRIFDRRRMLLAKIVGRFKMLSAKKINDVRQSPGIPLWQRNYYEHIVRDDDSLNRIRQYIIDNPTKWEFDEENPIVNASKQ